MYKISRLQPSETDTAKVLFVVKTSECYHFDSERMNFVQDAMRSKLLYMTMRHGLVGLSDW